MFGGFAQLIVVISVMMNLKLWKLALFRSEFEYPGVLRLMGNGD